MDRLLVVQIILFAHLVYPLIRSNLQTVSAIRFDLKGWLQRERQLAVLYKSLHLNL